MYWKPATARSASGRSRLNITKAIDKGHLKRDGAALIRYERTFAAPKPTSTDANRAHESYRTLFECANEVQKRTCTQNDEHGWKQEQHHRNNQLGTQLMCSFF